MNTAQGKFSPQSAAEFSAHCHWQQWSRSNLQDPRPISQDEDVRFPQEEPRQNTAIPSSRSKMQPAVALSGWFQDVLPCHDVICPQCTRKKCTMGVACPFAHSREELNSPPDLSKTKLCAAWLRHVKDVKAKGSFWMLMEIAIPHFTSGEFLQTEVCCSGRLDVQPVQPVGCRLPRATSGFQWCCLRCNDVYCKFAHGP